MGPIASQVRSVNTHAADCFSSRSSHTRCLRATRHVLSARRQTHPRGSATQPRAGPPYCAILPGRSTPGHMSLATPSRSPASYPDKQRTHVCRSNEIANVGWKWGRTKTYLEEGVKALFRGLFLEAFLLFGTEVARLFGLLYLVEHGLELNCRSQSRHAVERQ